MIERRPDANGRSGVAYPAEWGEPPKDAAELRAWILRQIERRVRGASVGKAPRRR
jgi:hypothetical protein